MTKMTRRVALLTTAAMAAAFATVALADGLPPLKQKATYKVGFAQTESNNPWRLAQTASMKAEAEKPAPQKPAGEHEWPGRTLRIAGRRQHG